MPQLDPSRSRDAGTEDHRVRAAPNTAVAPYQPLKPLPKVQLPPLHVTVSVAHCRYANEDSKIDKGPWNVALISFLGVWTYPT